MDVNKVDVFTIDRKLAAFEVDKNKELDEYYDSSGESSTCFQKLGNHLGSIFRVTSSLTLEEAEAEYEARKERREATVRIFYSFTMRSGRNLSPNR